MISCVQYYVTIFIAVKYEDLYQEAASSGQCQKSRCESLQTQTRTGEKGELS